ncbi:uncharacterized protein LOC105683839 isoform X1 [Athalia rosae]|uniref:uncharacterized protein LOC105683839 isoform X1 n=2 Tax=Athalia rosae TaxID=37344 RepID=UPI002033B725|nr:uncharacterized protein LOC105683839 isoform X1 [Athalia rosae]
MILSIFISLGIFFHLVIWRYIFTQFFKVCQNCPSTAVGEGCEYFEANENFSSDNNCDTSETVRSSESMMEEKSAGGILKTETLALADDKYENEVDPDDDHLFDDIHRLDAIQVAEDHTTTPETESDTRQFDRERKDLDTLIRRAVAAEIKKCCEKEHAAMSRTHSDTSTAVKRKKFNKRAVNFCAKSPLMLTDVREKQTKPISHETPKENLFSTHPIESKKRLDTSNDNVCPGKSSGIESGGISSVENFENVDNGIGKRDVNEVKGDSTDCHENNISTPQTTDARPKKKEVESDNAKLDERPDARKMTDAICSDEQLDAPEYADASTQTEHKYMIRATRSCPGRRKRIQLLSPLHEASKVRNNGKSIPMEITQPAFLYRKASDNLIYEKGKGSRSPSYVPAPERFRWRYVTCRKSN